MKHDTDDTRGKDKQDAKDKLSWREIDQRRDRKQYEDKKGPRTSAYAQKRASSQAKAALENLFKPKIDTAAQDAWNKVVTAKGSSFAQRATAYVEEYGLPKTWDGLLKLLDHPDPTMLERVLDALASQSEHVAPHELELAVGQLRIARLTLEDEATLAKLEQVLSEIEHRLA